MYTEYRELCKEYAKRGILFLIPYQNPWCWMNEQTVRLFDEVLDVLFKEYNLPENLPIVMRGGSMGGLSALTYTAYAKRTPVACVVEDIREFFMSIPVKEIESRKSQIYINR